MQFLYGDLPNLLKDIYSIIIKPNMNKCETALKLEEIDLQVISILVPKEIDIGLVALTHTEELKRGDEVSKTCFSFQKKSKKVCDCYY